jgi:hypothetical protein
MAKQENPTITLRIESVLGGHAPTTHFASPDQFRSSIAIDPGLPAADSGVNGVISSGLLRPTNAGTPTGAAMGNVPLWILNSPKDTNVYVYDAAGSTYKYDQSNVVTAVSALSDGGSMSSSSGNGAAYYDNYLYFAKNTDIARYGPMDGSPTFNGSYWTGTLGKTALVNTAYPRLNSTLPTFGIPNHVLHRHSDGRLYIADVVGNQGTIHFIKTTKTTVEGDTDNGSTYNALQFGQNLWPTAMESYGSDLVIALVEGQNSTLNPYRAKAKVAFWDTTSTNFNKIIWVEFPDTIITAMRNIDGVLYLASGHNKGNGFRISRFVGGYTVEEVFLSELGVPPLAGAMDGNAQRLLFGSYTSVPENAGSVFSYGLQKASLGTGLFNILRSTNTSNNDSVTALALSMNGINNSFGFEQPFFGWSTGFVHGFNIPGSGNYGTSVWQSQMFRIGQPFKVKKVRIPLAQAITSGMTVTPKIYIDDSESGVELTPIDNANFSGKRNAIIRPNGLVGDHNLYLELRWTGTTLCTVGLPITIEIELLED